jgi:hypothetical protein
VRLAALLEAAVEGDEGGVSAEGGGQGSGVERAPQAGPATGDMTLPAMGAAVVVKGGQAGQRGGLFAAERAQFGQADQNGQRGALADAGDTEHEIAAGLEVVVALDGELEAAQLALATALQPGDLAGGEAAQAKRRRRGGRRCSRRVLRRAMSSSICSIKVR